MSFTSIGRYLKGRGSQQQVEQQPDCIPFDVLYELLTGVFESINRTVLTGNKCEHLRSQLTALTGTLTPDLNREQATDVLETLSRILIENNASGRQAALAQAIEVQHIFAMLNQALIVLAEGRDRSVSRLNKIQESLLRTSALQDIVALKSSLAETVKFVEAESTRAKEAVAEELSHLESEVSKSREFLGSNRAELAGRPEGVARITEGMQMLMPGNALYAVAYLFDRLPAIKQRYGPEVADEMVFRIIKERLQPVAPASATFRWSSSSIVGIFERVRDLEPLRVDVANLNRTPVVHRVALGSRTAVLTVTPSHLVAEGTPSSPSLIAQVDGFTNTQA